jgi:hypothetical protein
MPFDKFVSLERVNEERRKAVQQSLRSVTIEEVKTVVNDVLAEFEGDPWKESFVRVMEEHPQGSFYRAAINEGAILLYCPEADTGVWVLPGSGMGPLPEPAKSDMKEAIAAHQSGRSHVRP